MTESATPICDIIADLLSRGTSPDLSLATARKVEAAITAATARGSVSAAERRERERLKKERQRARKKVLSPGHVPASDSTPILSKTPKDMKKVSKEEAGCPVVPGDRAPADDWPDDFVERFWNAFPPYRRQAKAKVGQKLARIRAQTGKQKVTWATLFGGALKFAATNPGEFAPAPMVWLNDGRWDREYGTGGSNGKTQASTGGKVGFAGIAARLRRGGAEGDGELPLDQPPGGPRR